MAEDLALIQWLGFWREDQVARQNWSVLVIFQNSCITVQSSWLQFCVCVCVCLILVRWNSIWSCSKNHIREHLVPTLIWNIKMKYWHLSCKLLKLASWFLFFWSPCFQLASSLLLFFIMFWIGFLIDVVEALLARAEEKTNCISADG